MRNTETIIDFGSSKVVCIIGASGTDGQTEIYGSGVCEHKGLRWRNFVDEVNLRACVHSAVESAQDEARRNVRSVFVGVPGPFLETVCRKAELMFGKPHAITDFDIDQLIDFSLADEPAPNGCVPIHNFPVSFKLDGVSQNALPIGQVCQCLSGIIAHVYMHEEFQTLVEGILEDIRMEVKAFVDSTYAEGRLLVPSGQREGDSLIIDVGYYHSDLELMRNSSPIYHKTLFVGGAHLAKDISYVLGVADDVAESVKRRHVFGLDYSGRVDNYRLSNGSVVEFDYDSVQEILEARVAELTDMICALIEEAPVDVGANTPIFMCGGGLAMMRGGREYLQSVIGLPVTLQTQHLPRLNSHNYISAHGVLAYALEYSDYGRSGNLKHNRVVQSLLDFFTK